MRGAIVTGGSRGIGRAVALELGRLGYAVLVNFVSRPEAAAEVVAKLQEAGGMAVAARGDVGSSHDREALVRTALERFGRLDLLVNNAGITSPGRKDLLEATETGWDLVFNTNLKGPFFLAQRAANEMVRQIRDGAIPCGKIINISSVRAFQGRLNDAAYAPSKGAVNQLTHSMAIEWGPRGINVNALAPVFTRTAMAAPQLDNPQTRAWILSRIAMKRPGELDDLFGPIVFLASDASNFVNGHVLVVDGGWLAT